MPTEKSMDFVGSGRRLIRTLRPERLRLTAVVGLSVGSVALSVVGPKLLGRATDIIFEGVVGRLVGRQLENPEFGQLLQSKGVDPSQATITDVSQALSSLGGNEAKLGDMLGGMSHVVVGQGVDFGRLAVVLAAVVAVYLGSFVFGWVAGRLTALAVQNTARSLRNDVEAKLSRLPLKYVDGQPRGELLSRVTNDIDNVAQSLQQTLSQLITALLTVLGVLAMMFWISPVLALVALVTVPLSGVVAAFIGKQAQPSFVGQWKHTGEVNAHIEEMFTGHTLITVFGRREQAQRVFDERNAALYASAFRAMFVSGTMQPVMGFIANINYLIVAVFGGLKVASGTMTLGDVQAFIQYSRQFTQPITQIASMANLMQSGVASAERVFELLDATEQDRDPDPAATVVDVRGRVVFDDVSFSYDPACPLIEHLDLVAEPGQTIAIVGPTGAGKTTLVNLVMRFYEVDAGRITLDGVDTRTLTRDHLRHQIGMVLQDTWLYSGTIADNIAYGVDGATREQVVEAAKATHVDRFVRHLPDGYDTIVDDDGGTVSAGEKQLLTITRAFLADRAILILDEATSSVDTRTEVLVQQAMATLRAGRTSFVIAHRLSTIRDADTILVMEHGQIVEQGSHDQLLAAGGVYARLYRSQFAAAAAEFD
ncbi:MAG: ABC transporter ATP-binding protein/permease [Micrococcales bacterium]|nr:ABC transporter ATP-binding protein/permease [Micrococcales bacterium]